MESTAHTPKSSMETLDSIIEKLVLPTLMGSDKDIELLHKEVQFCLWAMNVSLSVYMKLLSMVDIKIRTDISDVIGKFLAEWKDADGLSDALDVLIISEFTKQMLTEIPDMATFQRQNGQILSSTVACYIKDIAIELGNNQNIESAINTAFPPSESFIGRRFFPRLAAVSSKLLELGKV